MHTYLRGNQRQFGRFGTKNNYTIIAPVERQCINAIVFVKESSVFIQEWGHMSCITVLSNLQFLNSYNVNGISCSEHAPK